MPGIADWLTVSYFHNWVCHQIRCRVMRSKQERTFLQHLGSVLNKKTANGWLPLVYLSSHRRRVTDVTQRTTRHQWSGAQTPHYEGQPGWLFLFPGAGERKRIDGKETDTSRTWMDDRLGRSTDLKTIVTRVLEWWINGGSMLWVINWNTEI